LNRRLRRNIAVQHTSIDVYAYVECRIILRINREIRLQDASKTRTLPRIYSFAPHTAWTFATHEAVRGFRLCCSAYNEAKNSDGLGKSTKHKESAGVRA
jgi:hypothetical protein